MRILGVSAFLLAGALVVLAVLVALGRTGRGSALDRATSAISLLLFGAVCSIYGAAYLERVGTTARVLARLGPVTVSASHGRTSSRDVLVFGASMAITAGTLVLAALPRLKRWSRRLRRSERKRSGGCLDARWEGRR